MGKRRQCALDDNDMARFALPRLSAEETQELLDFWHPYEEVRPKLQVIMRSALDHVPEFAPILRSMSQEVQDANERRSQRLQRLAIVEGKWDEYLDDLQTQGATYANMGLSFSVVVRSRSDLSQCAAQ